MNTIEKINRDWDFVIGIEVHVQLETKSKMFSTCEYSYNQSPNTLTCPTSIGLPGALPSINEKAIDFAIQFGGAMQQYILLFLLLESIISIPIYQKDIKYLNLINQ